MGSGKEGWDFDWDVNFDEYGMPKYIRDRRRRFIRRYAVLKTFYDGRHAL